MAKIIKLKNFKDDRGILTVIQKKLNLKLIEHITSTMQVESGEDIDIKKTFQALISVNGSCEIFVENKKLKKNIF